MKLVRELDPTPGVSIATLAWEYPLSYQIPDHAHGSNQLIYATGGVMEVSSGRSMWLIPPQFALWVPARTEHRIRMPGPVSMRTLYLRPSLQVRAEPQCVVLHVTALLRELILEAVRVKKLRTRNRYECALRNLLIAQLRKASQLPASILLPSDPRALAVAQAVIGKPAQSKSMAALCAAAGISVRTTQRLFLEQLGTTFEVWRGQVRLTKAIELLVAGHSVKETTFAIGFSQPSAFVELFRRTFGTTPKAWLMETRASRRLH